LSSFYFRQVGLPNYWRVIFLVLPKLDGCQIDLPNCWSCQNYRKQLDEKGEMKRLAMHEQILKKIKEGVFSWVVAFGKATK
jgi:hypothetical protein